VVPDFVVKGGDVLGVRAINCCAILRLRFDRFGLLIWLLGRCSRFDLLWFLEVGDDLLLELQFKVIVDLCVVCLEAFQSPGIKLNEVRLGYHRPLHSWLAVQSLMGY
jgi:hypothetical protein